MAFPQLTPEQMLARCDLAGIARVVSVGRARPDAPNVARLDFVQVVHGEPRGTEIFVRLRGAGDWSDWWDYPVGATVMTHLDWNGPDAIYETTWPGAVWEWDQAA